MKNIATKSIHKKEVLSDGIRICVMRRIRPEYKFHIWLPELAPPENLLKKYVLLKKISWVNFAQTYKEVVLKKRPAQEMIDLLIFLTSKYKITLLCGEDSYKNCHRSLIIKECVSMKKRVSKK